MSSTTTTTVSNNRKTMSSSAPLSLQVSETKSLVRHDEGQEEVLECGRERLKRHRADVAGRVWIPDIWGQEDLLKEWIDCSVFDTSLAPKGIMSAREALAQEQAGRRRTVATCCSSGLEVGSASC